MIKLFKANDSFVYTSGGYRIINNKKNLKNFAEIIFREVKQVNKEKGETQIVIEFSKKTFIEHSFKKYPGLKSPEFFSPFTKREVEKFWEYYKKLAEATL